MKIIATALDNSTYEIGSILFCELVKSADAPCDSLSVKFRSKEIPPELNSIKAFEGSKIVFNGFVDTQSAEIYSDEFIITVYARSSACLLVDNEAQPQMLFKPCFSQLFMMFAKPFGFINKTERLFSEVSYDIQKGTSCYGAMNNFVYAFSGRNLTVTPENEMKILKPSDNQRNLESFRISGAKQIINRGELISDIVYKINGSDSYSYHLESRSASEKGISRKRLINLSGLPPWQRESSAHKKLCSSFSEYNQLEVTLIGYNNFSLLERVIYPSFCSGEYLVSRFVFTQNENKKQTKLLLYREIDAKEINYVDK